MSTEKKPKRELRHSIKFDDVSRTDQSYKKRADVNNIVASYRKTGILPNSGLYQGAFIDVSDAPTLEDAFEAVKRASLRFQELPADVRKLMDNDPSKLEIWLSDANNKDLAAKHGLIELPKQADNSSPGVGNEGFNNNQASGAESGSAS
jgi:hypothetical protein